MEKDTGNVKMLGLLNQVRLSREEKQVLLVEVPRPAGSATGSGCNCRMRLHAWPADFQEVSMTGLNSRSCRISFVSAAFNEKIADSKSRQKSIDNDLTASAKHESAGQMTTLLYRAADTHAESDCALVSAASNGRFEVEELLLDGGAGLGAAEEGDVERVRDALVNGADVYARYNYELRLASAGASGSGEPAY